tara:strand:+ start:28 stop:684 length:657 start_codon:yes stop_codon:yes gene_type:complete
MARLFVGQREVDFFADITKEIIKDVAGQKIYYYTVREDLSDVHNIYEESMHKIFNPPIELECLVEWQPSEVKTNQFGHEQIKQITAFLHGRDLIDRDLNILQGDYISYGEYFFEITSLIYDKLVYGQVERIVSLKLNAKQTRIEHIFKKAIGPTYEGYNDADAIQTTFEQQRGTTDHDTRQLQKDEVLESPISGPNKVAPDNSSKSINNIGSSFYGDK